jgi:hypothetical protein
LASTHKSQSGTYEEVLLAADVGDVHVVSGGAELFKLLGGEDVDGDQVDLGVTVLAGLGGGHFDDLARAVLDDDETVLPQSRALHGVGGGGTGIGALEGVLMLYIEVSVVSGGRIVGIVKPAQRTAASRKGGVRPHAGAVMNVPARRRPW